MTAVQPNWDLSARNTIAVSDLAKRASILLGEDKLEIEMDLTATHNHAVKLNFKKLASFDDFNFAHDINGIRRHLNRETLILEDCFLPRCAKATP